MSTLGGAVESGTVAVVAVVVVVVVVVVVSFGLNSVLNGWSAFD